MNVGEPVELYSALEEIWADGFEIAEVRRGGYGVRRLSDGAVIPNTTSPGDLRAAPPPHHWAAPPR